MGEKNNPCTSNRAMQAAAASDDFRVCLDGRPPRQLSPRQTIRATADEISDAWRCCLGQARILRHHANSPSVPLSGLPFLKGPPPVVELVDFYA